MKTAINTLIIGAIVLGGFDGRLAQAQTVDNATALSFLAFLSSRAVQRPLKTTEINQVNSQGVAAIPAIIGAWGAEPSFALGVQRFVEDYLRVGGTNQTVNFDMPGNLAKYLAAQKRPYSELITSTVCVNAVGQNVACDTLAPFSAGVLTTRAFLVTYKGAYNISRAGKITKKFLCTSYPYSDAEEPRLALTDLIPQFSTTSGAITFGNGNNCYSCHSQFGRHAQFFVKFDLTGIYRGTATGLQQAGSTDGFSANGLLTSHLVDPARAASESSQILGKPAANLREAALIVAASPRFLPCATQNMMKYYLRLSDVTALAIKPELYQQISEEAKKLQASPSFVHLLQAIATNPHVLNSYKQSGARL